jgi:DNA mismatch repair ATPase MutS
MILLRLQSAVGRDNHSAAAEISRLKKILAVFQLRGRKREFNHQFYSLFNNLWFFDVYLIILTEQWKNRNRSFLREWVSAISEFEALTSLAGFHYSNPAFTFAEIVDNSYNIDFQMLGHPLISTDKRVLNDFSLGGQGEIVMITGSNMAGKSTFLRTVGVNVILALAGAPCCARSGQVSNLRIFTSMRTQDSLEEGVSSFYAELKRLEQLLKLIESGQPVCFLLDEMFKGTNSRDRHKGGLSLIKQLKELNAFGIISTHDLDLAILVGKHKIVTNYSFNSSLDEGEMIFSYALTEGLCSDFNASELMKRSGIKVLSDIAE